MKRPCPSVDQAGPTTELIRQDTSEAKEEEMRDPSFKRFKGALLLVKIAALPHVISTIETFLMSAEEAVVGSENESTEVATHPARRI